MMGFSKVAITFYLVQLPLLLHLLTVNGDGVESLTLKHKCSKVHHYSPTSSFASNMNDIFNSFFSSVPVSGFGQEALGTKHSSDRIYGIALCTGNVRNQECKNCLEEAGREIRKRCPSSKRAIIWYENCMMKYSDKKFFGSIDRGNHFHQCNPQKVTSKVFQFQTARQILISSLIVGGRSSPNLYTSKDVEITQSTSSKMYGFSQCTRDLSPSRCSFCLAKASRKLILSCKRRVGGEYFYGGCSVRYGLQPFPQA